MAQISSDPPPPDKFENSQQSDFPMDRKSKIHKSTSAADLTPANRNSFADYALAKSAAAHLQTFPPPVDGLSDIDGEPDFILPSSSTALLHPPITKPKAPCFSSDSRRLDLTAARREYEKRTESQKAELKAVLKRAVLSRLKELPEMEANSKVAIEIAEAADFLKALYGSGPALMEISEKSREGVMRLQEGQLLVKKSQDQLRSLLRHRLFSID